MKCYIPAKDGQRNAQNNKDQQREEAFQKTKDTVPSWEEDFMANHFRQYAAHRPYVHY